MWSPGWATHRRWSIQFFIQFSIKYFGKHSKRFYSANTAKRNGDRKDSKRSAANHQPQNWINFNNVHHNRFIDDLQLNRRKSGRCFFSFVFCIVTFTKFSEKWKQNLNNTVESIEHRLTFMVWKQNEWQSKWVTLAREKTLRTKSDCRIYFKTNCKNRQQYRI